MSSPRLPPLTHSSTPNPDQRAAITALEQEASKTFGPPGQSPFIYKDASSGALVGPFPFFLAAPDAGTHFLALFRKLAAIPGLSPEAREIVILTVGAHFEARYELYAHSKVAVGKVGMERRVVEMVARGEKPGSLSEACSVAFDAAKALVEGKGRLDGELWERCVRVFGREGTVALVHYVGAYAYTCIVLNAMDAPVPE